MEKSSLTQLLKKYSLGTCTEQEKIWVENWYINASKLHSIHPSEDEIQADIKKIYKQLPQREIFFLRKTQVIGIAAAILGVFLAIGIYLFFDRTSPDMWPQDERVSIQDIRPGQNHTVLRLSSDSVLVLDQLMVGKSYDYGSFVIRKIGNDQIEYVRGSTLENQAFAFSYNEITTSAGGQYQVVLPDGSKVWLNAQSTLKYPTRFNEKIRSVELVGEAYFEVAKRTTPFHVHTGAERIEVLGTHFNVNSYVDEGMIKVSLLEGSVKVIPRVNDNKNLTAVILKPGEQALLLENESVSVRKFDVSKSILWTKGLFSFQGDGLETVMHEFSRWYGVEVGFKGEVPDMKLWGEVHRNVNASKALEILEYFDLNFEIVNKKGTSIIEIYEK